MEFLFLCLGTTIVSFTLDVRNELKMIKDIENAGYKIDIKKIPKLSRYLNPNAPKINMIEMFIPIFNMLKSAQRTIEYDNAKIITLDQLDKIDILQKITASQPESIGLNAILIPYKFKVSSKKDESNDKDIYLENILKTEEETFINEGKFVDDELEIKKQSNSYKKKKIYKR